MALIGGIPMTSIRGIIIMPAPPEIAFRTPPKIEQTVRITMIASGKSIG
jgi:hypothetical protein